MNKRDQQILFWMLAATCIGGMLFLIFTSHGAPGILAAGLGTAWMLYAAAALILLLLSILLPYFVFRCARELRRIREMLEDQHRKER